MSKVDIATREQYPELFVDILEFAMEGGVKA